VLEHSENTILFEIIQKKTADFVHIFDQLESSCSENDALIGGKALKQLNKDFKKASTSYQKAKKNSENISIITDEF
jgi:hypothetical protein